MILIIIILQQILRYQYNSFRINVYTFRNKVHTVLCLQIFISYCSDSQSLSAVCLVNIKDLVKYNNYEY